MFKMKTFTGIKRVDAYILSQLNDVSLCRVMETSKYLSSFNNYEMMWKYKILDRYGKDILGSYDTRGFKNFYVILCKISREYGPDYCFFYDTDPSDTWKEYYDSLRRAGFYEIPKNIIAKMSFYSMKDKDLTKIVLKFLYRQRIKVRRGDVIHFSCIPKYRNTGKRIYDGKTFINLDYTLDPDGNLPSIFHVLTPNNGRIYPLDYWEDCIDHNDYVWLDLYKIKYHDKDEKNSYGTFMVHGKLYYILFTVGKLFMSKGKMAVSKFNYTDIKFKEYPGIHLYC